MTALHEHDGYAPHSHEVRADHLGVRQEEAAQSMTATYEPALCMRLRAVRTDLRLYVILAADGTPLDAMAVQSMDTVPLWVTGLVQLPEVDVTPSTYREWKRHYTAASTPR